MKPPFIIMRNGMYYVDFPGGGFGWVCERKNATVFERAQDCIAKSYHARGFIISVNDTPEPSDILTVRLTARFSNRPGFDLAVCGVNRENLAELQRDMLAHVVGLDGLMSASVELVT